jgi:surfactin synthase thioesterase subunit/MFS family permease
VGTTAGRPPAAGAERTIAEVWAEVLGVPGIVADQDFFDLGGHSLLATQVVARLRERVGAGVTVLDIFRHRTVEGLARLVATPDTERRLLHKLKNSGTTKASIVCVPYGGGNAVVYQPLADALPDGYDLWAVAVPGNDLGLDESRLPFDELARRCADEILSAVDDPIVLYGHCVGGALTVEIARRLEAAGRAVETVYLGATFPFALPGNRTLARLLRTDGLRSDQQYVNWLISVGLDLGGLPPEQARQVVRAMRADARAAEEHFTRLFSDTGMRVNAPIVTIVGERDADTEFHQERYREWHALTDRTGVVVLPEAGHYFLKYRARELAAIVTGTPELSTVDEVRPGPTPGMGRFLAVAAGQLVSITGSALTEFAVPVWIYVTTGSLGRFALFSVLALVPGLLVAPLAGAVVDRTSRKAVMLAGDVAAGLTQLGFGLLLWTGHLRVWEIYPLLVCLSVALTFQRLASTSAVPQLVPKRYLGHANGVVQMAGGMSQLLVPLVAVGLLAAVGLPGILALDVASYAVAVLVTLVVRFPGTMAWRRKEPLLTEISEGLRYSWGNRSLRAMLLWFAGLNVFLAPMFLLMTPLVLSFAHLRQLGVVAFGSGLGGVLGGLLLTVWGGPRHRRMYAMLLGTLALGACGALAGIRPNLLVVAVAAWGLGFWITVVNGIYATIVQVKVPQRFHGRVFSLNTLIAWSTIPLGIGLVGPYATRLLAAPSRHLAPLLGTGPGRGIGLTYLLFGLAVAAFALWALRFGPLRHFDGTVPDATPDDLVGVEALRRQGFSVPE